jgi:CheY-like chemotaxis protein
LKPGKYIQLIFQDNGSGISSDNLSRIFDPYYTTKPLGSGLGLAICYSIIKKHDGHIAVKSQLGKGTIFYIYLPASQKATVTLEDKSQPIPKGHGRILIMDDEPSIRQIVTKILLKLGYEVEAVPDGNDAIRRYAEALKENKPFDAVIMDLTIPGGMGGQEAVTHLLELNPQAKVLVSSGYNNDPVLADFKTHGFAGVVIKPYTQQTLSRVLHQLLKVE